MRWKKTMMIEKEIKGNIRTQVFLVYSRRCTTNKSNKNIYYFSFVSFENCYVLAFWTKKQKEELNWIKPFNIIFVLPVVASWLHQDKQLVWK